MNSENLVLLKKSIINEVFKTSQDGFIFSGTNSSDIWIFDFRKVILQPKVLNAYAELFFEKFNYMYPFQVGGIETASIPLISAIVMKSVELNRPVNGFFIRKSRKKSGLLNMIEGKVEDLPIILVDDLMNSGGSFIRQIEILSALSKEEKMANLQVSAVHTILQYKKNDFYSYFLNNNIKIESLFNLNEFKDILPLEIAKKYDSTKVIDNKMEVLWRWKGLNPSLEYVIPKSSPLFYKDRVYFGSDTGLFVCLNSKNGEVIWTYQVPVITKRRIEFSSPCALNDLIYFGSNDGNFYAFDAKTGKREWTIFDGDWIETSPATSQELNLVFIPLQFGLFKKTNHLCALDAKTGVLKWKFESIDKSLFTSPIYCSHNKTVLISSNTGNLYSINAQNGDLRWKQQINNKSLTTPDISADKNFVTVTGSSLDSNSDEHGVLAVFKLDTGLPIFKFEDFYYGSYGSSVTYKDLIIFTSLDKHIYAVDIESGKQKWKVDTGARIFSTPSIFFTEGKPRIYVGSNNSVLYEIEPDTGTVTSMTYLIERITSKISFDPIAETIFVPTYANEIYALKRKGI